MNEQRERWTVRVVEEGPAQAPMPSPESRPRGIRGDRLGAVVAFAAAAGLVLAIVMTSAAPSRVADPQGTPSPTFARNDSGTPLPTEAEVWGGLWSQARAVNVLRPTWLPRGQDHLVVSGAVNRARDGSLSYSVSYYESEVRSLPGSALWRLDLLADPIDAPARGLIQLGGASETVLVRGHAAELNGNGSPGWALVWSEGDYRYAIQAFAVTRDELLRIANSLAPVINDKGETR